MTIDGVRIKRVTPTWVKTAARLSSRSIGMATAPLRTTPDFLIIGTKRGGTTSLWNYLIGHPSVLPMYPGVRGLKSPAYFFEHYDRGANWYRSYFHTRAYTKVQEARRRSPVVSGESSPYYLYGPHIPGRVRELMPDVKLVVLLRDPVKRAYSHYWERVGQGVEPLSFEDALAAEPARLAGEWERMLADPGYYSKPHDYYTYRDRGVYRPQLERWFEVFPRDQMLVMPSERFYGDTQPSYDRICDFLGIVRSRVPSSTVFNEQSPPAMDPATRGALREFYRPHNDALFDLVGDDYGWNDR